MSGSGLANFAKSGDVPFEFITTEDLYNSPTCNNKPSNFNYHVLLGKLNPSNLGLGDDQTFGY